MSDEENSGVFSRRKDYERRVPVATIPLPVKGTGMSRMSRCLGVVPDRIIYCIIPKVGAALRRSQ